MKGAVRLVAAAVLAGGAALLGASASEQGPGHDLTRVAENVYTFRWNTHRNLVVITGDGVIVTDPLNPRAAAVMMEEIRKLTDQPVRYVVYSHEHWDHVLGGRVFKDAGATFISHARCLPYFQASPHPDLVPPDLTFHGPAYDLELGGRVLELRYFGPNHGECLTVMRLPDEKLLYVVDIANPRTVGFRTLPDFQPRELIRSLQEIEARLDFERIVPGHQDPVAPASVIAEQRRYYQDLMEAVEKAMRAGVRDPAKLVRSIRLPRYQSWDGYEEWLPLNVERAWAYFHMGW